MALLELTTDLSATNKSLKSISESMDYIKNQLHRLILAIERLSPEIPAEAPIRQATLSDLRSTAPSAIQAIKAEFEQFAKSNQVTIGSEAFFRSIVQFEKEVVNVYGPEAINDLPWNKAAGGPIFRNYQGPSDQQGKTVSIDRHQGGQSRAEDEKPVETGTEADKQPAP